MATVFLVNHCCLGFVNFVLLPSRYYMGKPIFKVGRSCDYSWSVFTVKILQFSRIASVDGG